MERVLQSFENLDEGRRKRVRHALEAGDRKTARQELAEAGIASDEDIEAYLVHLEEEQRRLQVRLLEEEAQLQDNQEEEELLMLAMDALKLEDKAAVPCPRCNKANVSLLERKLECPNCKLSITWDGSLEEFREYLAQSIIDHAKTNCQNARPLVDSSLPSQKLFMHCFECDWARLASHA